MINTQENQVSIFFTKYMSSSFQFMAVDPQLPKLAWLHTDSNSRS